MSSQRTVYAVRARPPSAGRIILRKNIPKQPQAKTGFRPNRSAKKPEYSVTAFFRFKSQNNLKSYPLGETFVITGFNSHASGWPL